MPQQTTEASHSNRTLAAAGAIGAFALIIGFIDNYVQLIAAEIGIWQFHALRTLMVMAILLVFVPLLRLRLRPVSPRAVLARSLVHAAAMLLYFAALAFLPVAQAVAGLFTAPIFVLLFSRFVYGQKMGPVRVMAVALGFCGILVVLGQGPGLQGGFSIGSVLPVAGGILYALANIATRQWCSQESAQTLTVGFFLALGVFGLIGMAALALWPQTAAQGASGFLLRGAVWPSASVLFLVFVQAIGSLIGVGLLVRGYQLAEASRAAVFEYALLPAAVLWGWLIWGEAPAMLALAGMALIVAAGLLIVLRGR
jgi:drug/metabolite transporter (DMT)-like permease